MRVEEARWRYRQVAEAHQAAQWQHAEGYVKTSVERCYGCLMNDRRAIAASLVYDLAVAEESRDRVRAQVAWA